MNRREFLRRAVGAGAAAPIVMGGIGSPLIGSLPFASIADAKNWSDPSAWPSGSVPGPNDVAMVMGSIVVDQSVSVAGIEIMETGALYVDPGSTVTIESTGNIVNMGLLSLRPTPSAVHTVRFVGVNENAFVGGGHEVVATDVGLWTTHMGILDAVGTPKVAWNRTGNDATWSASDQLIVAPTDPGDWTGFKSFSKGSSVPVARGQYPAEVLNLTRNVVIEGTPGGRSHVIFAHAMRPQTVQYVEIRHVGPRQPGTTNPTDPVVGRYGVHFHHCGEGSRGSLVEGVVVHQAGNHAFVPHASHGVTMRNCIAYDVFEDAYWWDLPVEGDAGNNSHDSVWDSNVAALVKNDPPFRGYGLAGFLLGHGDRNTCVNSVAIGIQGNDQAAGFRWPPKGNTFHGVWKFKDNVAHNNKRNGMSVWQNNTTGHIVESTLIYQMGAAAIDHGAYTNHYEYHDVTAVDCENVAIVHATGVDGAQLTFANVQGESIRSADVQTQVHPLEGSGSLFVGGDLRSVEINNDPAEKSGVDATPGSYDFVDTGLTPDGVTILTAAANTITRIQNGDQAWQMDANGNVTSIALFYSSGGTSPPTTTPTTTAPPPPTTTTTTSPGNGGGGSGTTTTTTVATNDGPRRRRRNRNTTTTAGSGGSGSGGSGSGGSGSGGSGSGGSGGGRPRTGDAAASVGGGSNSDLIADAGPNAAISGLGGGAGSVRGSGPISKRLVTRTLPVSLNVPAALGPQQLSPAAIPGSGPSLSTPGGLAIGAAAAAAVMLYRRRIMTTEIPDTVRTGPVPPSAPTEVTDPSEGDPWG